MNRYDWTADRVAELRRLRDDGKSAAQIAIMMGVASRNAVLGKLHRLGEGLTPGAVAHRRAQAARANVPRKPKTPPADKVVRLKPKPVRLKIDKTPLRAADLTCATPFLDLGAGQCRWPEGDGPYLFCARPADRGLRTTDAPVFCGAHARLVYQPIRKRAAA